MTANESRPGGNGTASKLLGGGSTLTIPRTADKPAWRHATIEPDRFLTLDVAADHIGTTSAVLRARIRDGLLPAYRYRGGRSIRVRTSDVEALALADELVSITRAAAMLAVSDTLIRYAIQDGDLIAHPDPDARGARVRWSDVLALMTRVAQPEAPRASEEVTSWEPSS